MGLLATRTGFSDTCAAAVSTSLSIEPSVHPCEPRARRCKLQTGSKQLAIRAARRPIARHRPRGACTFALLLAAVGCKSGQPNAAAWESAAPAQSTGGVSGTPAPAGAAGTTTTPMRIPAPMPATNPIPPRAGVSGVADAGAKPPPDAAPLLDDDGGTREQAEPVCDQVSNSWILAPGFLLSRRVDYVADRNDLLLNTPLSTAGIACATARNKARCMEDLALPATLGRHLVTTSGDKVEFWQLHAAFSLLGLIDTAAEAIWMLSAQGYEAPCSLNVEQTAVGYRIENVPRPYSGCVMNDFPGDAGGPLIGSVMVYSNGQLEMLWPQEPCILP